MIHLQATLASRAALLFNKSYLHTAFSSYFVAVQLSGCSVSLDLNTGFGGTENLYSWRFVLIAPTPGEFLPEPEVTRQMGKAHELEGRQMSINGVQPF